MNMDSVIFTLQCPDQKGLIAGITRFVFKNKGNIINLDQYADKDLKTFFMRLEWDLRGFAVPKERLAAVVGRLLEESGIRGEWELCFSGDRERMAILVSGHDHCLYDLLLRHRAGELGCDIPVIIGDREGTRAAADHFGVPFEWTPAGTERDRPALERTQLRILKRYGVRFVVLARYMRVLSPAFLAEYPFKIINIHHSFLPAFKGAGPYRQAFEKGVKIIGATAHFVTKELDQGPIIHQDIIRVSHKDAVNDLVIKGRDIERQVLAEAVKLYLRKRIFVRAGKTFIL